MKNFTNKSVDIVKSTPFSVVSLVILSVAFLFMYLQTSHSYLRFSDGAKFADIARNIVQEEGYVRSFTFFGERAITWPKDQYFNADQMPPLMPYSMAAAFRVFGVSDSSVILTSSLFFLASVVASYFVGKHLFGGLVGFLSALSIASNINLLDYATSGASEIALIFSVLVGFYFLLVGGKLGYFLSALSMYLVYLARPQAIIFIFGFIFYMLIRRFGLSKAIVVSAVLGVLTFAVDRLVIYPLSWSRGFAPLLERGFQSIAAHPLSESPSDVLRGAGVRAGSYQEILSKLFYNLFNFYKRIPDIMSPYLAFSFVLGFFIGSKKSEVQAGKFSVLVIVIATFFAAALTIPFFRYIHPVVPLVYIFAVGGLVEMIGRSSKTQTLIPKQLPKIKFKISKDQFVNLTSIFLILVFVVGLSAMTLFVDWRFNRQVYNLDKPPVYALFGGELKAVTGEDDVILTNLDTWGSWYGERKTIWLPVEPAKLVVADKQTTYDAIFLTDYLADDENHYLGEEWKSLLDDPAGATEGLLEGNFEYVETIYAEADEVFENTAFKAVLFLRKITP